MILLSNIAFDAVENHKVYQINANRPDTFRLEIIERIQKNGLLKECLRNSEIITIFFVPTCVELHSGYYHYEENNEFLKLYKFLKKVSISKLIRFIIAPRSRQLYSTLSFDAPLLDCLELIQIKYKTDDYDVLKDDFNVQDGSLTYRELRLNMTQKGLTKIVNILRKNMKKRRREEGPVGPAKKVKTEVPERNFTSAIKISRDQYERFKIIVKTQINEFENFE